jgi:hypothetical protein
VGSSCRPVSHVLPPCAFACECPSTSECRSWHRSIQWATSTERLFDNWSAAGHVDALLLPEPLPDPQGPMRDAHPSATVPPETDAVVDTADPSARPVWLRWWPLGRSPPASAAGHSLAYAALLQEASHTWTSHIATVQSLMQSATEDLLQGFNDPGRTRRHRRPRTVGPTDDPTSLDSRARPAGSAKPSCAACWSTSRVSCSRTAR